MVSATVIVIHSGSGAVAYPQDDEDAARRFMDSLCLGLVGSGCRATYVGRCCIVLRRDLLTITVLIPDLVPQLPGVVACR